MKWQTAYQGTPLLLNRPILVQNQFLALHHQLYAKNYNTGLVENSGGNGVRQQNSVRPNNFWDK